MSKVIYFNITYNCNSNCMFCFSNSTGLCDKNISFVELKNRIKALKIESDDMFIINGGEPSIHKEFYEIVSYLCKEYDAKIVIYSNGRFLDLEKLILFPKIKFVIPIHGIDILHDKITREKGSFSQTMKTILKLNEKRFDFAIKFIMNYEMISSSFNIKEFIKEHNLNPTEIFLARLNETKKSKISGVVLPSKNDFKTYLKKQFDDLKNDFKIKFLDIPICYFEAEPEFIIKEKPPVFYFNDVNKLMMKTDYYKDLLMNKNCEECKWKEFCKAMNKSYLTLSYKKGLWKLEKE